MFIYTNNTKTHDKNIPLKDIKVNASIVDIFGNVTISQTFKNNYSSDIEAVYCFNLDTDSCVSSMNIQLNCKTLVSQINERTQARNIYNTANIEHKTTCLLEMNGESSYKVNLGSLQAGQEIVVELKYVTTLMYVNGVAQFVLPTNIAPKYNASNKTIADIMVSALKHSFDAYYSFSFNLNCKSHDQIIEIKSQTNEIQVTPVSDKEVNVTSNTSSGLGDFNLQITTKIGSGLYYFTEDENTYVAVTHKIPEQSLDLMTVQKEFIFVVDRSGSMQSSMGGWSGSMQSGSTKMDLTKDALVIFINSLPPKSKFNIYSFGNNYCSMFPHSVNVTNENVKTALEQVATFTANMGGTEIFNCLKSIFTNEKQVVSTQDLSKRSWKLDNDSEYEKINLVDTNPEKVLILLTDGQVANPNAVIDLCTEYNYLSRVLCIGIGSDVDRNLVKCIGKASNGYSEVLIDNDDVSGTVVKMLDMSLKSYYKNVSATIQNKKSTEHTLYPNQSFNFFTVMPTVDFNTIDKIQITGIGSNNTEVNWSISPTEKNEMSSFLKQLYARDLIQSYLNDNSNNKHTSEIIKLSMKYSLVSKYTSFVVVETDTHVANSMQTIIVPQSSRFEDSYKAKECSLNFGSTSTGSFGFGSRRNSIQPVGFGSTGGFDSSYDSSKAVGFGASFVSKSVKKSYKSGIAKQSYQMDECERQSCDLFDWDDSEKSDTGHYLSSQVPDYEECDSEKSDTGHYLSSQVSDYEELKQTKFSKLKQIDYLLNFKKVDGSFSYDDKISKTIGVSVTNLVNFALDYSVTKGYLINLLILEYLGDVNNDKYKIIKKMLESWLSTNAENIDITTISIANINNYKLNKQSELTNSK